MRNLHHAKSAILIVLILGLSFAGCKKSKKADPGSPPKTGTRAELTKDSIYLYAQQTYYWNTSLPSYASFNPRGFSTNEDELVALTKYSLNPATGKNYEYDASDPNYPKYSFIDDGTVASEIGGTAGDYGFSVFYKSADDLRVKYVYGSSPAALKGLKRGYQIIKLNERTDLVSTSNTNVNFVVNAIFGSNATVTMTVRKPDNTTQDISITRTTYTINPILYTNVYTVGAKKVGYIVFNSFTTNAATLLTQAFANFATQGVSELVVDLRYNGGGSVETAELLSNLIVPAVSSGGTMYDTYFNQTMQSGGATILKNQKFLYNNQLYSYFDFDYSVAGNTVKFAKTGTLAVNRAYFIVTGSTASASELTINNLRPVMDVKLIGSRTYGKPVGFFALHIDKLDLYIPQFETKNKAAAGGYYTGLAVDKEDLDDLSKEFGDPTEKLLSYALNYADKGVFAVSNPKDNSISSAKDRALTSSEVEHLTFELEKNEFKGMVGHKLKPKH